MSDQNPDVRLAVLERDMNQMQGALVSISDSLSRLVALEERHAETRESVGRAFKQVGEIDDRLGEIEKIMPGLIESRSWLLVGMGLLLTVVIGSIMGLVLK